MDRVNRISVLLICIALVVVFSFASCAPREQSLVIWTQESTTDFGYQFVQTLVEEFAILHPYLAVELVSKETDALRVDFQNISSDGDMPDLLWTVNDHVDLFALAGLIQPIDRLIDTDAYIDSVVIEGKTWAVPISGGNHLMLLYNKNIISEPPRTTDEMIAVGKRLTSDDRYGLVWNQTEPLWLIPWLGGFGGQVFAEDGVTPTLDTPEMIAALQFLSDLKNLHAITPQEADYSGADRIFKEGRAAMIINGDWSLGEYRNSLGADLGIAPLPLVTDTNQFPTPYISGRYLMIPVDVKRREIKQVIEFVEFVTNYDNQLRLTIELNRLPALRIVLEDPLIADDPVLGGASLQLTTGTPMPSVVQMRCNWDVMKPGLIAVLSETKSAADAASDMQAGADSCVVGL